MFTLLKKKKVFFQCSCKVRKKLISPFNSLPLKKKPLCYQNFEPPSPCPLKDPTSPFQGPASSLEDPLNLFESPKSPLEGPKSPFEGPRNQFDGLACQFKGPKS